MCEEFPVALPTMASFLMLYPLVNGCLVVLIWTVLRSFFTLFFFVVVVLEALVRRVSPFGVIFVHSEEPTTEDNVYFLYYCSIIMIIVEAFLFIYCCYLALGACCQNQRALTQYLMCRFITWLIEITILTILVIVHKLLIGWYLGFLLFIILEFYGFLVVYSYKVELSESMSGRSVPGKQESDYGD